MTQQGTILAIRFVLLFSSEQALAKAKSPRLQLSQFGPIQSADVFFGDLTVIVGPQATGKSIFLQTLKLLIDRDQIHDMFNHHSMSFGGNEDAFLDAFYGRGIAGGWSERSAISFDGKAWNLRDLARPSKSKTRYERLFYIPAQRVMSLPNGVSQNFGTFNFGDPYVLRSFSDAVHDLIQNDFATMRELFPAPNRLNESLREPIAEHLFGRTSLVVDDSEFTKRLALQVPGQEKPLGFLSWSAGQREFTPMLMGLYWLCTSKTKRKSGKTVNETIDWVVIEEPEMGLHPKGIQAVLLLVLELLRRNYRVVLSTHTPVVLEMVWALQELKKNQAGEASVRKLFDLKSVPYTKELATSTLQKDFKVYYFDRNSSARDISNLDPMADAIEESEWGGVVGFASKANAAVTNAVHAAPGKQTRKKRDNH
ncbi:AAA family ATPase [Pandoraea sputorum]|uniref:AAA family ATPase n=1 Tax=Pandoraea sputorum TaxID=93222 RepID=UPI001CD23AD3|nr:AAA family ATPase [Pandoraea sputorum]